MHLIYNENVITEDIFKNIIETIKIPLIVAKPLFDNDKICDFEIVYTNPEFNQNVCEIKDGSLISKSGDILTRQFDWVSMARQTVETGEMLSETFYSDRRGVWFSFEMSLVNNEYVVVTLTDISAKIRYTEQLKLSLVTDTLTALPNRIQFYKDFKKYISKAEESNKKLGLLFFDVDNLKSLNDSEGQQAGDMILIKAARIFKSFSGRNLEIYRFGGDEFIVIAKSEENSDSFLTIADAILESFSTENINVSGGISIYPDNTTESEDLIKFADLAMHDAKKAGKNRVMMFTPEMQKKFLRGVMYKSKMPGSFEKGDFKLFFQPQFNISTNTLRGFEALLRWDEPELGSISPEDFIPMAEESGFINVLGEWVLNKAFVCQREWEEKFDYHGTMSVNASPVQLMNEDFLTVLEKALKESGVNPAHVEIEVTEGVLINDTEKAVTILDKVKAMGFGISLDDFGTGYSSLRYLQLLPLTTLKIDKSFIQSITEKNGVSENITNSIISMVTKMGLDTIAEGVEKVDQLLILRELNCKTVQGFLRGKPMSQEVIEEYLGGNKDALDRIRE